MPFRFQVVDPASNFCYADMADMVQFSEIRMAQEWEELLPPWFLFAFN